MDRYSSKNQGTTGKFVEREVYARVNGMVDYILSQEDGNAPFSWEDVKNIYTDNSDKIKELEEEKERFEDKLESMEENEEISREIEDEVSEIESRIEELESEQNEAQEPMEWWIVSDFLARKLEEYGQVIIDGENIWGRLTSGQAILLDGVISDICEEMEILEGQRNEW